MSRFSVFSSGHNIQDENEDPMTKNELSKLNTIWKQMKDSKKMSTTSGFKKKEILNSSLQFERKSSRSSTLHDLSIYNVNNENNIPRNLDDKTIVQKQGNYDYLTKQLREQNGILTRKLDINEQELEKSHQKIAKLMNQNSIQQQQLKEMTSKLEYFSAQQKNLVEKSKLNTTLIEQDLDEKEQFIEELRRNEINLENRLNEIIRQNKEFQQEQIQMTNEIIQKSSENERLKQRLEEVEKSLDDLYAQKIKITTDNKELSNLRNDVQRLFNLLKNTKEFKEFAILAEESKDVTFLNYLYKNFGIETNYDKVKKSCSCSSQIQRINEFLLWIPKDAFKLSQDIATKYNNRFSTECIENLLFGLNKIWTQREENKIKIIQKQNSEEINNLKRLLDKNTPYDDLQARRKVHRLKQSIQSRNILKTQQNNNELISLSDISMVYESHNAPLRSRTPIRRSISRGSANNNNVSNNNGITNFATNNQSVNVSMETKKKMIDYEDVIRLASEYETELRQKNEQIEQLNQDLNRLKKMKQGNYISSNKKREDNSIQNTFEDKVTYIEGTIWMAEKTLSQLNKFRQNLVLIQGDFSDKIEKILLLPNEDNNYQNQNQTKVYLESYHQFNEKLEHIVTKFQERIENMKKSANIQLNKINPTLENNKENHDHNTSQFNPNHTHVGTISTKYDTTLSQSVLPSRDTSRANIKIKDVDDYGNNQYM